MPAIVSSIVTVFLVGLSTGGLLVSKKITIDKSLFTIFGLCFYFFSSIGIIIGMKLTNIINMQISSIIFGLFCLCFIYILVRKYNPFFGYVKEELQSVLIFACFFFLLGIELAQAGMGFKTSFIFGLVFSSSLLIGFSLIFRLNKLYFRSQLLALAPLLPIFLIAFFKLL